MPDQPTDRPNIITPAETEEAERKSNPKEPWLDEDVSKWVDISDPSQAPESGAY